MSTLIIDIETVGEDWDTLDAVTKETLLRWVERTATSNAERDIGEKEVMTNLGLSPLTGNIVAIGLYDLERDQGVVYYVSNDVQEETEYSNFILKPRSEKDMLEDFWNGAQEYETFVTFNGRSFDIPFLLLRSAMHGIQATVSLMDNRYLYQQKTVQHVDLQDQMTFYGAMRRRPSLHLFCRAFGIESPKTVALSGSNITELFYLKKFRDIAEYNARDVTALTELYKKWRTYLAPQSFLNRFDTH